MRPNSTIHDVANVGSRETKPLGERGEAVRPSLTGLAFDVLGANLKDRGFGDFGVADPFATALLTESDRIGFVRFVGVPTEIHQGIVGGIAIEVAALHPFGTRTDKRFEHKAVNETGFAVEYDLMPAPSSKDRPQTPPPAANQRLCSVAVAKPASYAATPHAPVIADAVTGKASNFAVLGHRTILQRGAA